MWEEANQRVSTPVQLVSQYLENISREALETYQDLIRHYIRRRQGVYALYRKGSLWYVGLAGNLSRRLKDHLRDRHKESWDRFSVYLTIGATNMKEMESLLLRVVMPPGNKTKGRFLKAENLRQRFAADIRRRQRERLDSLIGRPRRARTKSMARETKPKAKSSAPLAPYVTGPMPIRARHNGRRIRARIRRDGSILYNHSVYNSPSAAAKAVRRRRTNGWAFWEYQRAPGDWVKLTFLRLSR